MPNRARRRPAGTALKIVVTGPYAAGKTTLIRTISEITVLSTEKDTGELPHPGKRQTTVAMDFGRITVDRDLVLYLFGTPGQDRFQFMWDILGEGMLGYVLLLDAVRPDSLDDASGILTAFRRMAPVPFVVGLNRTGPTRALDADLVREALSLPPSVPVLDCDATDRQSVKTVLLTLLRTIADSLEPAAAGA